MAFEQGRLLDPADLTDDALFRSLREDENARILTTDEVEDRQYIRAKPTQEELQRTRALQPPMMPQMPSPTSPTSAVKKSQEDAYWEQQERIENFGGAPNLFSITLGACGATSSATNSQRRNAKSCAYFRSHQLPATA